MIVWSGMGILVIPLVIVTVAVFFIGAEAVGLHPFAGMLVGFLLAAPLTWMLGQKLNGPDTARTLVDPQTGGTVLLKRNHSLFFIPVQYWAIPCVILSALLAIMLIIGS